MKEAIFVPSKLYKELLLFNILSKGEEVTQRELSSLLSVSVTMVNKYLNDMVSEGLLVRNSISRKQVSFTITNKGIEKRRLLIMEYLKASMDVFTNASVECKIFLNQIVEKGFKKILLYGAGEVGELLLYTINNLKINDLEVLAVIDDDVNKIGKLIINKKIINIKNINKYKFDGVLISSFKRKDVMRTSLHNMNVKDEKILEYI